MEGLNKTVGTIKNYSKSGISLKSFIYLFTSFKFNPWPIFVEYIEKKIVFIISSRYMIKVIKNVAFLFFTDIAFYRLRAFYIDIAKSEKNCHFLSVGSRVILSRAFPKSARICS